MTVFLKLNAHLIITGKKFNIIEHDKLRTSSDLSWGRNTKVSQAGAVSFVKKTFKDLKIDSVDLFEKSLLNIFCLCRFRPERKEIDFFFLGKV